MLGVLRRLALVVGLIGHERMDGIDNEMNLLKACGLGTDVVSFRIG